MEGILICGVVLAAVMIIRSQGQGNETEVFATVRDDSSDSGAVGTCTDSSSDSFALLEYPSTTSSDDDWPTSSMMDDIPVSCSYWSGTSMDTDRWTDPMYAYEPDNIYHNTAMDPTYHDDSVSSFDDSCSNLSGYGDTFSPNISDDSWSSSSSDDLFSSCSSFDD